MVSFRNTEVAFSHLNDQDLKNARNLFSVFKYKYLSAMGPRAVLLMLKIKLPILGIVKKTMFSHFCGGETVDECKTLICEYGKSGVGAILDYSVEGAESEETFDSTMEELIKVISEASQNPNIPFSVFKVTGICSTSLLEKVQTKLPLSQKENQRWERARLRFEKICQSAFDKKVRLFVDAEESWIQKPIDELTEQMMEKYNKEKAIIFNTVQLYRSDRLNYVTQLYQRSSTKSYKLGLKLVRGAYMEKERERASKESYISPIHIDKNAVDKDFDLCVEFCLTRIEKIDVCVATHNEESVQNLIKNMKAKGLESTDERIWCAQLLGMSDHISFNLAKEHFNTAKYVPYGPVAEVLPYLFRRAEENSSIQGQSLREYDLLEEECERRHI
ncbi:proline dehydrogenase family protein [bacterium]|nr:proline dehydrogenase family protein [bacterium]